MKKETILTAVAFFVVGFLAGYAYNASKGTGASQGDVAAASAPSTPAAPASAPDPGGAMGAASPGGAGPFAAGSGAAGPGAGQASGRLPEGHPQLEFATTVKFFEDQATKNPSNPQPPLVLANYLYDQKHFTEAVEWYQKALALDPKNINARTDLGTAYYNLGKSDDAIREYLKSLEADPNHQNTLFNLIVVNLNGKHDPTAAAQYWERLHKINPNHDGLAPLTQELETAGVISTSSKAAKKP